MRSGAGLAASIGDKLRLVVGFTNCFPTEQLRAGDELAAPGVCVKGKYFCLSFDFLFVHAVPFQPDVSSHFCKLPRPRSPGQEQRM